MNQRTCVTEQVALHYMMQIMKDDDSRVLFVAKNRPLALSVAKWLSKRAPNARRRKRLLGRIHLLSEPLHDGPCSISEVNGTLRTAPVQSSQDYGPVVIDEAHHIYRDEALRSVATHFLGDLDMRSSVKAGVIDECVEMQKLMRELSKQYLAEMRRPWASPSPPIT